MKIAFLVSQFPSTSETFILNQATALMDRGHQISIFARKGSDQPVHEDVSRYDLESRTEYLGSCGGFGRDFFRDLSRIGALIGRSRNRMPLIRALNVFGDEDTSLSLVRLAGRLGRFDLESLDVLHCHFGPNGRIGALLKTSGVFQGQLITTFYGHDVSSYIRRWGPRIYRMLFEAADQVLCLSQRMGNQLVDAGCPAEKVYIHRLGIDLERFEYAPPARGESEPFRLLTIARLVEKKGVEYAIRALKRVVREYPNIHYTIVGDGFLRSSLEELVGKLGLDDKVTLVGWKRQSEIASQLSDSHLLLVPSVTASNGDEEGTPTVILEALARGVPVISTCHSGIPELIENGMSGFLVPERDPEALAEAIGRLVRERHLSRRFSRFGREYVEKNHDIRQLTVSLEGIYRGRTIPQLTEEPVLEPDAASI